MLGSAQYGGQVSKSVSVCMRLKSSHAHSVGLKASLDIPFTTLLHVVLRPVTLASAITLFLVALCLCSHCPTEVVVKANIILLMFVFKRSRGGVVAGRIICELKRILDTHALRVGDGGVGKCKQNWTFKMYSIPSLKSKGLSTLQIGRYLKNILI